MPRMPLAHGAARALRVVGAHPPADDPARMDPDDLGTHVRVGRVLAGECLGGAADLEAAHRGQAPEALGPQVLKLGFGEYHVSQTYSPAKHPGRTAKHPRRTAKHPPAAAKHIRRTAKPKRSAKICALAAAGRRAARQPAPRVSGAGWSS